MAELLGRILAGLIAELISKGVSMLPPKVQHILGSLVLTLFIGPTCWCLTISTLRLNLDDALSNGQVTLLLSSVMTFLLIYFVSGSIQNQRERRQLQDQFVVVKDLLREHRDTQALEMLATIDHPKAREWEAKLRNRTPNEPDFLKLLQ